MTGTLAITPLSEFAGDVREFLMGLLYPDRPGRSERFNGDHRLLELLDHAQRAKAAAQGATPAVSELGDHTLRLIVSELETALYGRWQLDGDEGQPILERLDAHFLPMQRAHAEHCAARDAARERAGRDSAELDARLAAEQAEQDRALWGLPA